MRVHSITAWSVPTSLLVLAGGGGLLWLGFGPGYYQPSPLAMVSGTFLAAAGLALLVFSAHDRVRHDAVDRKLHKYGCPKCGYEAHLEDVEAGDPYPCPTCSRPVYE